MASCAPEPATAERFFSLRPGSAALFSPPDAAPQPCPMRDGFPQALVDFRGSSLFAAALFSLRVTRLWVRVRDVSILRGAELASAVRNWPVACIGIAWLVFAIRPAVPSPKEFISMTLTTIALLVAHAVAHAFAHAFAQGAMEADGRPETSGAPSPPLLSAPTRSTSSAREATVFEVIDAGRTSVVVVRCDTARLARVTFTKRGGRFCAPRSKPNCFQKLAPAARVACRD